MGSECKPSKFRYDIAMSKRTRKPSINPAQEDGKSAGESFNGEKEKELGNGAQENDGKKSLKELIGGRSLSQHFSDEEKQLPLIAKPHDQEGLNRLKLKRMVSRYAKVLSNLIKLKRKPESAFHKKPFLKLTNQVGSCGNHSQE